MALLTKQKLWSVELYNRIGNFIRGNAINQEK